MADTTKVKAIVFPQWTLKWQELGKAALLAGISAGLTLLYQTFSNGGIPTLVQFKAAGLIALTTAVTVVIRDFVKPTTTVIKGHIDPVVDTAPTGKTVTVTDTK